MVSKSGAYVTELSSDSVQHIRVEFNDHGSIDVVAPGHKLAKDGSSYLSNVDEMIQKYQSIKEAASYTCFQIELSVSEAERQELLRKRGMVEPRVLSWFVTTRNCPNTQGSCVKFSGPKEEVEVVKAIVEDFYESCTWRYGRVKSLS